MSTSPQGSPGGRRRRISDAPVTAVGSVIVAVFALVCLFVHAIMPVSTMTTAAIVVAGTLAIVQGLRHLGVRDEVVLAAIALGVVVVLRVLTGMF